MVYEDEEPDARDPNYDEAAQVRRTNLLSPQTSGASIVLEVFALAEHR